MRSGTSYAQRRAWGEALRRKRIAMHIDQFVLSMKAETSRTIISQYERSGVVPSVIVGQKIAEALDWSIEEWANDADQIEEDGSWYDYRFDKKYDDT